MNELSLFDQVLYERASIIFSLFCAAFFVILIIDLHCVDKFSSFLL
jgi:hypothetical protein